MIIYVSRDVLTNVAFVNYYLFTLMGDCFTNAHIQIVKYAIILDLHVYYF